MAVPEQTPYIEHTGNGVTKSFSLGFICESKNDLIVMVDEIEPPIATWSLTGGNVVFTTAPAAGKKITLQRNTPFSRTTDYQSYNNSFRPPAVNKDFDWIWLKLQELGVADWILGARIDALKNYVDRKDDELKAYLLEEIRKQGVALDQLDDYYNYLMQRLAQIAVDRGWMAEFVIDASGKTQQEINDLTAIKVDDIASLLAIESPRNGQVVELKSVSQPIYPLKQPFRGGSRMAYDASKVDLNDGVMCFNGWVRDVKDVRLSYTAYEPMVATNGSGQIATATDATQYIKQAVKAAIDYGFYEVILDEGVYLVNEGEIDLSQLYIADNGSRVGVKIRGVNKTNCVILFRPTDVNTPCFTMRGFSGGTHTHVVHDITITSAHGFMNSITSGASTFYKGQYFDWDAGATYKGVGIETKGICFMPMNNVDIYYLNIGIKNSNVNLTNAKYNEFLRFSDIRLFKNNINHLLINEGGDGSFHGCSWHNVMMQVKDGGVGLKLDGGTANSAVLYNADMHINFFGGSSAKGGSKIVEMVNGAEIRNSGGLLTAEGGVITFSCDNTSRVIDFKGDLVWLWNTTLCWDVADVYDATTGLYGGRVKFRNVESWGSNNTPLTQTNAENKLAPIMQTLHPTTITQAQTPIFNGVTYTDLVPQLKGEALGKIATVVAQNYAGVMLNAYNTQGLPTNPLAAAGYTVGQTSAYNASIPKSIARVTYGINPSNEPQIDVLTGESGVSGQLNIRLIHRLGDNTLSGNYRFTANAFTYTRNDTSTGVRPDLGASTNYFKDCYLQNAPTVVSDERKKSNIKHIDDALLDAWGTLNFSMWQLNSAIAEKGEDAARWHVGLIAQQVRDALVNAGLDWTRYGLITYESWEAVPYKSAVVDDFGNLISEEIEAKEAGEIYMLRMEECLVVEMAYQRRRVNKIEQLLNTSIN